MLNHSFTWNGHSSDEYGVKIERFRALNRPARKYDVANVQGRNGNLYALQNAWDEVLVSYEIFAKEKHVADHNELYAINRTILNVTVSTDALGIYTINGSVSPLTSVTVFEGYTNEATYTIKGAPNASTASGAFLRFQLVNSDTQQLVENGDIDTTDRVISCHRNYYLKVQLYMNAGTYNNVRVPFALYDDSYTSLDKTWTDIMEWLNSADGYAELSDTYDTEHYREAVFVDATDIANSWNEFGRAIVSFRCRPERFLFSANYTLSNLPLILLGYDKGTTKMPVRQTASVSATIIGYIEPFEYVKVLQRSGGWSEIINQRGTLTGWVQETSDWEIVGTAYSLTNPTRHTAKPIITLPAAALGGTRIQINDVIMEISQPFNKLVIDCESENVTGINLSDEEQSFNQYVTISVRGSGTTAEFMRLEDGENFVSGQGSTAIKARFWEI